MPPNKKQRKTSPNKGRKRKVSLVFDETKRRDFLTGFHKRKIQRKKQAQERLETQLKEERRRLKRDAKESYRKLVVSGRPVVGLEHILEEEYADDDVTVKITEVAADDIARRCNAIGSNFRRGDDSDDNGSDIQEDAEVVPEIPGMELRAGEKKAERTTVSNENNFSSASEVKKTLKKMATKNVQKSTVFQMKNQIERRKQKKKAMQKRKENMRIKRKMHKKSHKKIT